MNGKKLVTAFAIGGVIAAAGVVGVAAPAMAAQGDCGTSQSCLWKDTNYGSTLFHSLLNQQSSFSGFNDVASSLYNRQAVTLKYYTDAGFSGVHIDFGPNGSAANLSSYGQNDTLSSWTN